MKLVHPALQMKVELIENQVIIWEIESPAIFRKYLEELLSQSNGQEGKFVLSADDLQEMEFHKNVELILSPFEVDVNDKKYLNKIYAELKQLAFEEKYYLQTQQLCSSISSYLLELEQDISIHLTFEREIDFGQIIKASGIKIEDESRLLEKLVQYLQVAAYLMKKRVIIFVGLSMYLEEEEREELLKQAFYLKLYVILLEQQEICCTSSYKRYIIDKDECEIF